MNTRVAVGHSSGRKPVVYTITFDLDTAALEKTCHDESVRTAYTDVGRALRGYRFERMQGSVCFGKDTVDAVSCVLAVQQLASDFGWFAPAGRDIRMLRIEDNDDLMPAIERVAAGWR